MPLTTLSVELRKAIYYVVSPKNRALRESLFYTFDLILVFYAKDFSNLNLLVSSVR